MGGRSGHMQLHQVDSIQEAVPDHNNSYFVLNRSWRHE